MREKGTMSKVSVRPQNLLVSSKKRLSREVGGGVETT